jgi:hypothetical protein
MYCIFYSILGLFAWLLIIIFQVSNVGSINRPTYAGIKSPIISSTGSLDPGMGVRPHFGAELSKIEYSLSDIDSMRNYVETLNIISKEYAFRSEFAQACTNGVNPNNAYTCRYDLSRYMSELDCNFTTNYGYSDGLPCVLIKLNNVRFFVFFYIFF